MRTILTVGIPNSGKTTAVNDYCRRELAAVFSPDKLLEKHGQYIWTPERAANAWRQEYQMYGKLLRHGGYSGTVIWDATFTSRITRCALVNIARAFGRVEAWLFATPLEVCIQRNSMRPPDRQLPEEKLKLFFDGLEVPTLDEGFHEVVRYSGLERIAA